MKYCLYQIIYRGTRQCLAEQQLIIYGILLKIFLLKIPFEHQNYDYKQIKKILQFKTTTKIFSYQIWYGPGAWGVTKYCRLIIVKGEFIILLQPKQV